MCLPRRSDSATRFLSPSQNLLQFVPPGNPGMASSCQLLLQSGLQINKTSGRLDFNSHLGSSLAYFFDSISPERNRNAFLPGFGSDFTGRSQVVNLGDSKTLGAASVNELRFGFTRIRYLIHKPTGGNDVSPLHWVLSKERYPRNFTFSPSICARSEYSFSVLFRLVASWRSPGSHRDHVSGHGQFQPRDQNHTLTFGGQFATTS